MNSLIQQKTKIPIGILDGSLRLDDINIASKMRWAANRITTREEDVAYSLMGLFDIQMTLQYGEGKEKAFLRLQMKILQQTGDPSIFAWKGSPTSFGEGLLAPSPKSFDIPDVDHDDMIEYHLGPSHDISTWAVTNLGLRINLYVTDDGDEPSARLCAYLEVMDKKTGKLPTLDLYQIRGFRYRRGPRLKFRDPPKDPGIVKSDLIVAFTSVRPRRRTPQVAVLLPSSISSDTLSVELEGRYDCKWTPGPDEGTYKQMICRETMEENGFYMAVAKVTVLRKLPDAGDEGSDLIDEVQDSFYLHCWLVQAGSTWSVATHIGDKRSRDPPPRQTDSAQSIANVGQMAPSKKGYRLSTDSQSVHDLRVESIPIRLRFPKSNDEKHTPGDGDIGLDQSLKRGKLHLKGVCYEFESLIAVMAPLSRLMRYIRMISAKKMNTVPEREPKSPGSEYSKKRDRQPQTYPSYHRPYVSYEHLHPVDDDAHLYATGGSYSSNPDLSVPEETTGPYSLTDSPQPDPEADGQSSSDHKGHRRISNLHEKSKPHSSRHTKGSSNEAAEQEPSDERVYSHSVSRSDSTDYGTTSYGVSKPEFSGYTGWHTYVSDEPPDQPVYYPDHRSQQTRTTYGGDSTRFHAESQMTTPDAYYEYQPTASPAESIPSQSLNPNYVTRSSHSSKSSRGTYPCMSRPAYLGTHIGLRDSNVKE